MSVQRFVVGIIGSRDDERRAPLVAELRRRTRSLKQAGEQLEIVTQKNLKSLPSDVRVVVIVLCRTGMSPAETDAVAEARRRGLVIIPVVADLRTFTKVAPAGVGEFNGFELGDLADIGELAGLALEALGLQRSKRKIFISYARMDSSVVAQQLREAFTARWYSVFLDTISIRPGAVFQEELLQELADSDAVVLLNSENVKSRPYVQQEISFADQAGVSGVQVVWPGEKRIRGGELFMPLPLDRKSARMKGKTVERLTRHGIDRILRTVADMRFQMQLRRERELLRPVSVYARTKGWKATHYLGRHVELNQGSDRIRLDLALGVPTSLDLQRAFQPGPTGSPAGRLLYDTMGITNGQADHLKFLGSRLDMLYLEPKTAWKVIP